MTDQLAQGERPAVIADARLTGAGRLDPFGSDPVDVHLDDGVIVDIAPAGALARRGAVIDAGGGWVVPGLWDHHVHTVQWALVAQREPLGQAGSAADAAARMAHAPGLGDGRRVGAGFRDALWPDAPSLSLLDERTGEIPTYLINSDVHSVWMNTAAFRREGMTLDASGLVREEPAFEISRRLNAVDPATGDQFVAQALAEAATRGIVGVVDFDMAWNAEAWARRLDAGFDTTRIRFGLYPAHLDRALAEGLASDDALDPAGLVRVGPLKVITDGSLGTRTAACSHAYPGDPRNHGVLTVAPEELLDLMTRATAGGLACAIHAIGDVANSHALDAFAATGAVGTIEHAQLVAHADIPRFARLGVGASVQPEHAIDDRDMTDVYWAGQTALAYPLRALAEAGANLLFGSDAPVAALDPWAAMASAVHRTRDGRAAWHPDQAIDAATALAASTASGSLARSTLLPGDVADLVVVDRDPLTADEPSLRKTAVQITLLGGRLTHLA
ncbi:amidohydrolase [Microbacterium dextranolyticum]|uniref:Amidohydrolase n=1 Tax=Microbacterium dextranolyticum TaxID=36806 RepID=A0A9W6HMK8_9MICO|nr:amidohydrolase family protein [Microbacterium dextranolyticum]MBM7462845.1 putative amidohydrolase YtcJ [Microbacterium dextranolyticum]GLJ96050.1 amidohydrolase [Microbacterium dextranolyticum]